MTRSTAAQAGRAFPVALAVAVAVLLLLWLAPPAAVAAGGGGGSTRSEASTPDYEQALVLIQAERWPDAIALLKQHVQGARNDADGHNWLAYAYRKSGQLEPAFVHYRRALALVPTHRGAHEYIGEAYLAAGQPERAEHHLRELARICDSACEEYQDLQAAITKFRGLPATGQRPP